MSSNQTSNYTHVRNRLLAKNNIGRTYLWTKFAKQSLTRNRNRERDADSKQTYTFRIFPHLSKRKRKLWAVRASRGGPLRILSRRFLETLCRADKNSQRAATITFTGQTFHRREKGMESWGLRVSRLCFGSILDLEMS